MRYCFVYDDKTGIVSATIENNIIIADGKTEVIRAGSKQTEINDSVRSILSSALKDASDIMAPAEVVATTTASTKKSSKKEEAPVVEDTKPDDTAQAGDED